MTKWIRIVLSQYVKRCSLKDMSLKTLIGLVFLWSIA